jgi:type IV pilus assembly protein PilC
VLFFVPSLRVRVLAAFSRAFSRTRTGRKVAEAQLASVLALTFSGAGNIGEALELSRAFAAGGVNEGKINGCAELVMKGEGFAAAASKTQLFGPAYCSLLSIGERSGASEAIMQDIARRSEEEMDFALEQLAGRVEPAAVLILSLFVGLLLLSVMLPLAGLMSAL